LLLLIPLLYYDHENPKREGTIEISMGRLLVSRIPHGVIRCRECGKREGEDNDRFVHTLDELGDMTGEEKTALEWFSHKIELEQKNEEAPFPAGNSREEMIHLFVFENLLERLLRKKPICQTCFERKRAAPPLV
jgi:hypothetical protein